MGWVVGAVINVIGSVMINLGTNVIKWAHNKTAEAAPQEPPPLIKHPVRWWAFPGKRWFVLGMSLFGVGNILNFASFGFAAQSLLAALGNVQFLTNMLFARFLNKEHISRRVMGAMALVITGSVLLVAFGNHESPILTAHDLLDLYSKTPYIVYLCIMAVAVVATYLIYRHGKKAIGGLKVQRVIPGKWARWLPICYALFSGLLGTQSVLYGKTLSMLLRTTIDGDSQLGFWYMWLSLVLFIFFAAFWLTRYSKALRLFPVSIIMPTLQIVWMLFSIVSGSLYYQEYKTLDALSGSMFGVGIVIMLAGILLLTSAKSPGQAAEPLGAKEVEMEEHLGAASNGSVGSKQAPSAKLLAGGAAPSVQAESESSRQRLTRPLQDSADEEAPEGPAAAAAAAAAAGGTAGVAATGRAASGHAHAPSDDTGMQLVGGPSSTAAVWDHAGPQRGGEGEGGEGGPPPSGAASPPPALRGGEAGEAGSEVQRSPSSKSRLERASSMLEENDIDANFRQFARGWAGLDYQNPLSPAFTAFSMPLVPAVGPARCISTSALVLMASRSVRGVRHGGGREGRLVEGEGHNGVSYATRQNVETARGRHRAQRSHSTGELTKIMIGVVAEEVEWAAAGGEGADGQLPSRVGSAPCEQSNAATAADLGPLSNSSTAAAREVPGPGAGAAHQPEARP